MESSTFTMRSPEAGPPGTYDLAGPVERVKAIDHALRHYFDTDNWLAARERLFPGLRTRRSPDATPHPG